MSPTVEQTNSYETVIGLEVHVQLKTNSKLFCACETDFGAEPNSHVCPVCTGQPGVLPVLTKKAVLGAACVGIQPFEYSKLFAEELTVTSSQFGSAFFFLTGFHGLHVFVGVLWGLVLVVNSLRGGFTQADHMGVEVWGLYWHFVDVVWIFIFTLIYLL